MEQPLGRVERGLKAVAGAERGGGAERLPRPQPLHGLADGRRHLGARGSVRRREPVSVADEGLEQRLDVGRAHPHVLERDAAPSLVLPLDVALPERAAEVVGLAILDHGEVGGQPHGEGVGPEEAPAEPVDRVEAGGVQRAERRAHAVEPPRYVHPLVAARLLVYPG